MPGTRYSLRAWYLLLATRYLPGTHLVLTWYLPDTCYPLLAWYLLLATRLILANRYPLLASWCLLLATCARYPLLATRYPLLAGRHDLRYPTALAWTGLVGVACRVLNMGATRYSLLATHHSLLPTWYSPPVRATRYLTLPVRAT